MSFGVAVIGCGSIGTVHAECYSRAPGCRLVACADGVADRSRLCADRWGAASYEDYRSALERDDVGAVSVCLPTHLHLPVTVAALRAGKHVLCEKPIALTIEEARTMQEEARKQKRLLVIGVVNRFDDYVNRVRKTIEEGEIGVVHHVDLAFKQYRSIPGLGGWFTNRRLAGGGVMIDWGVHFVDLALYCTGFPKPLTITGVSHSVLGRDPRSYVYTSMWAGPPDYDGIYDVEEHVSGILRTDGPAISFEGAWAQGVDEQVMHVDFHGNKGGIRLNYGGDFIQYGWRDGALYQTRPTLTPRNMYQTQIDSFVHCAAEGKASPASIESVIVSQHVIDLFYSSSKVGKELSFR